MRRGPAQAIVVTTPVLAAVAITDTAQAAIPGARAPPASMASLGDSITRGFDACGWYVDCTNESWSTGNDAPINSHYRRILALNPAISGNNFDDARTGAKAVDLVGQAQTDAKIFIASVPDTKRLWEIDKNNWSARSVWSVGGICQSMLANPTSISATDVARRDRVRQRVVNFNTQLAQACPAYGSN